jgi:hypothetical protein
MDKLYSLDRKVDAVVGKTGMKIVTGVRSLVSRDKFRYVACEPTEPNGPLAITNDLLPCRVDSKTMHCKSIWI